MYQASTWPLAVRSKPMTTEGHATLQMAAELERPLRSGGTGGKASKVCSGGTMQRPSSPQMATEGAEASAESCSGVTLPRNSESLGRIRGPIGQEGAAEQKARASDASSSSTKRGPKGHLRLTPICKAVQEALRSCLLSGGATPKKKKLVLA